MSPSSVTQSDDALCRRPQPAGRPVPLTDAGVQRFALTFATEQGASRCRGGFAGRVAPGITPWGDPAREASTRRSGSTKTKKNKV